MGWNAVPGLLIITGIWVGAGLALDQVQLWREEKTVWAYNKDFYQRALLRRDWYLHREEETLSKWYNGEFLAANVQGNERSQITAQVPYYGQVLT